MHSALFVSFTLLLTLPLMAECEGNMAAPHPSLSPAGRETCVVQKTNHSGWTSNCTGNLLCCSTQLAREYNIDVGYCYDPTKGEACCVCGTAPPIIFTETEHRQCCGNLSWGAPQGIGLFDPSTEFCCGYWGAQPPYEVVAVCSLAPNVNNTARCCGSGDAMKGAFCCAANSSCYNPSYPYGTESGSVCCDTETESGCGLVGLVCCKKGKETCCDGGLDGVCCDDETEQCCQISGFGFCCPKSNTTCCKSKNGPQCCPDQDPNCCQ